jgi:hypothetical protein
MPNVPAGQKEQVGCACPVVLYSGEHEVTSLFKDSRKSRITETKVLDCISLLIVTSVSSCVDSVEEVVTKNM